MIKNRVKTNEIYVEGRRYELKRSYAGKYGALDWAAEIRSKGYYANEKHGRARVFRTKEGGWGVFVARGAHK